MTGEVGIRRALPADVPALVTVRSRTVTSLPESRDLARHLEAEGVYTYLAEDAVPFGFVTIGASTDIEDNGEILEWYLLPSHCNQGYGRKLLVHGLTVIKRRMFESAVIWLPAGAERARDVVRQQGFEPQGAERITNTEGKAHEEAAWVRNLEDFF